MSLGCTYNNPIMVSRQMAAPLTEGHTIVLAGAWNIRIFSPEWVASHLSDNSVIGLGVAMSNPSLPIRLQFRGIYLRVGAERLMLSPVELTDESLDTMQDVARRVLDRLSHTPVSGVGVNFQYIETHPAGLLLDLFRFPDLGSIADFGAEVKSAGMRRTTTKGGATINILTELRPDASITVEFNNHADVPNAAAAREFLNRPILELKAEAAVALKRIYGLE